MSGILVGDVRTRLDSVDAKGHAIMVDSMGTLAAALSKAQVLDMFRLGDLDEKVYIEMFDGLGSSGDVNARKIAEIIRKHQKNLLDRKNRAGANIGELENYVVRQMHDPLLMMKNFKDIKGSKAEWVAFIKPLLNKEKTFDGFRFGDHPVVIKALASIAENFTEDSATQENDLTLTPDDAEKEIAKLKDSNENFEKSIKSIQQDVKQVGLMSKPEDEEAEV